MAAGGVNLERVGCWVRTGGLLAIACLQCFMEEGKIGLDWIGLRRRAES